MISKHCVVRGSLVFVLATYVAVACKGDGTGPSWASLQGTVTTVENAGIPGAKVEVGIGTSTSRTTLTDATGGFRCDSLSAGTYTVRLYLPVGFDTTAQPRKWTFDGRAILVANVQVGTDVQLDLKGKAIVSDTALVQPGSIDTLATASGAVVAVRATASTRPLRVILEEGSNPSGTGLHLLSPTARLRIEPTTGSIAASIRSSPALENLLVDLSIWFVKTTVATALELGKYAIVAPDRAGPLTLFADATSTSYLDSRTGTIISVPLATLTVDASQPIDVEVSLARVTAGCPGSSRLLRAVDGSDAPDGRIPLILIHGWQLTRFTCEDFDEGFLSDNAPFTELIDELRAETAYGLLGRFKLYVYRYPTVDPVEANSEALWSKMQALGLSPPVLLGHSMGGLLGRAMILDYGAGAVRGVVTLGTPHEGSPLANLLGHPADAAVATYFSNCTELSWLAAGAFGGAIALVYPENGGLRDLRPSSDLIRRLVANPAPLGKVLTIAGQLRTADAISDPWLSRSACLISQLVGEPSDGVVPVNSAAPSWTILQTVIPDYDHLELPRGESSSRSAYFAKLMATLDVLSQCQAAPPRVTSNDFPLSGSVARTSGRAVDITLNPIVIDGASIAVDDSNIQIIENGCVRPFTITTSSGSVGVDVMFAQDLSSSMTLAIDGVRSSALGFAQDLWARGLNVRIGSVGYSGPGDLPTSPANSPCEFLGPVQDLTTPETFQTHVAAAWSAIGGCDLPENGLEAIEYAHNNMSWRAGAARVYIDITDASHHVAGQDCNGQGPCTDESLSSIVALVGSSSVVDAVAPSSDVYRTVDGGLDPYRLADATGGQKLDLGTGLVDLTSLGITDLLGQIVRLSFNSASDGVAVHDLRVRVTVQGKVAELAPGLVAYAPIDPSIKH